MTAVSPQGSGSTPVEVPTKHAISADEYLRMGDAGIFPLDSRYELIDGEIIDMPPIGPPHASRINRLVDLLAAAVHERAIVSPQNPVILGDLSAPQPDLALLRYREDYYSQAHPGADDILLLIEVSDTSLSYDRDTKLPLYARFRIPEVWILDLQGACLNVNRAPVSARYTQQFRVTDLSNVGMTKMPDVNLDLRGVF